MFFAIPNHSSVEGTRDVAPWEFVPPRPLPDFEDKAAFREWCRRPTTKHYFFSLYEGVNPLLRIAKDNPPAVMHGLAADYDSPVSEADWPMIEERGAGDFLPAWGCNTASGNARLVWLFEKPVFVYPQAHEEFLKKIERELKLNALLPGFEKDALYDTSKTYEVGLGWRHLGERVIKASTLEAWAYEAGKKAKWAHNQETVVPIERVAAEVEKSFPGRWQGEFAVGARGVRFWDSQADSQTGAVVRENGMQCFTGDKPFVRWSEIFSQRFVDSYAEDRVAQATLETYFDGRHYYRQAGPGGDWITSNREDTMLDLKVRCGLRSEKVPGASCSEVEQAIHYIQTARRIHAALPLVHQREGVTIQDGGDKVLNTSRARPVQPAENSVSEWGDGFDFIGRWLAPSFFTGDDNVQWDRFMAWLKRFYVSALAKDLLKGQSLFIAGPTDAGKTLLANKLIGALLGGSVDAGSVILGETAFNSSCFYSAVWAVDDSSPGKDPKAHAKFSANVKKLVANQNFEFLQKFKDAARINWRGRPVITLNDDAESMQLMPEAEMSILDKVFFLRAAKREFVFPPQADQHIRKELPAFGRWLVDWEVPQHCVASSPRFGVVSYHEPSLLEEARRAGQTADFRELLDVFRKEVTEVDPFWEGSSSQLLMAMTVGSLSDVVRQQRLNATRVGRELRKLMNMGYSISERTIKGIRLWRINRDDEFVAAAA